MSESLQLQVEESKSSEDIKTETNSLLDEANSLLELAEERGENIDDIRKEYDDIKRETEEAIRTENQITTEELNKLRLELSELKYFSEDIKEEYDIFLNEQNTEEIKKKLSSITNAYELGIFIKASFNSNVNMLNLILNTNNSNLFELFLGNLDEVKKGMELCPTSMYIEELKEKYLSSKKEQILNLAIEVYGDEEIGEQLISSIEEYEKNRGGDFCNLTLREVILRFDQENGNKLSRENIQKLIDGTLEVQKVEVEVESFEIREAIIEQSQTTNSFAIAETLNNDEVRIYLLDQGVNDNIIEQYIQNRNKQRSLDRVIENNNIIKSLNSEEYNEITNRILAGESGEKVMSDIKEKYYKEKTIKASNILLETGNISQVIKNNSGTYYFETINGEIINDLTKEELINLGENPEALNNLINTKNKLEELNLGFIWENREGFFKAMNIAKGGAEINNLDSDNISSGELLNILNFTLEIIGEENNFNDITKASAKLRELGNSWLDSGKKDQLGRSPIENIFIEKGYIDPNSNLSKFKLSEIIKGINKNS